MNSPIEIRKVIIGIALTMLWVCVFLFFNPNLAIQWTQSTTNLTYLKPFVILLFLLVIVFYHLFNRAHPETNKLSWTSVLTICWLALILFYPFRIEQLQRRSGRFLYLSWGAGHLCILGAFLLRRNCFCMNIRISYERYQQYEEEVGNTF